MYPLAEIVIENATPAFDNKYSYLIPEAFWGRAVPGCRVRIPFGRGNRERMGFILSLSSTNDTVGLKEISLVLDKEPLINKEGLFIIQYLREFTFCTWYDALRLLIPTGLDIKRTMVYTMGEPSKRSLSPQQIALLNYVATRRKPAEQTALFDALQIKEEDKHLQALLKEGALLLSEELKQKVMDDRVTLVRPVYEPLSRKLTPRQIEVLEFIEENPDTSVREVCYYAGTSQSVIDQLLKKEQIELYEVVRSRGGFDQAEVDSAPPPILSGAQQAAVDSLISLCETDAPTPALLYGVTGSGKTQVFLHVIEHVIRSGQGVIVMVPEISLTSQTIRSLQGKFGSRVAVLHSGLSLGERMDEWARIRKGDADIVVGTRSAVFAPLPSVGLIVMDEEQEHTYKSDRSPRFHAREVAQMRCKYHKGLLLLCSATPATESYYYAQQGRYHFLSLPERFGDMELPEVRVIDMKKPENLSSSLSLSTVLMEEITLNLERGEQSILLLNRRGYSTVVTCASCMTAEECPHCSVAMTYHIANNLMLCHYCGFSEKRPTVCSRCGSDLIRYAGIGTQQLEEELGGIYKEARILRMDMDSTMSRYSHEEKFDAFRKGEYDIMIGTQMVAKGLNFPNVTLVGVLNADQSLYSNDFRSYERSFALLTQVVGRSGRGDTPGRAFVQTWTPEHAVISYATAQDYPAFYKEEITGRKLSLYPPFCSLTGIGFVGEDLQEVISWANQFAIEFQAVAKAEYPTLPLRVLGPTPSEVLKISGKYRYKLIVKCRNDKTTRNFFSNMLQWFYQKCRTVSITIDMHYEKM